MPKSSARIGGSGGFETGGLNMRFGAGPGLADPRQSANFAQELVSRFRDYRKSSFPRQRYVYPIAWKSEPSYAFWEDHMKRLLVVRSKMKDSHFRFLFAFGLSVCFALIPTRSVADERCQQLEVLRAQYVGVELTPDQKQLKLKLVEWYTVHCRKRQAIGVNGADTFKPAR